MGKHNANIGHITGICVNSVEDMAMGVKKGVPAATNATKGKLTGWKNSVKAEYKKVREGEIDPRMKESIAIRAIELTTGEK